MTSPVWIVLAKGSLGAIANRVDDESLEIAKGTKGYVAITSYEPGSAYAGEPYAKALSKTARAYLVDCDPEGGFAQTWDRGKQSGDLFVSAAAIVSTLGCKVRGLKSTRTKADLTPQNAPKRKKSEWIFDGRTLGEWRHLMRMFEWSVMLDVTSQREWDNLVGGLRHADAKIRALCIRLASAAGIHNLREATEPIADLLMDMTDDDAKETGEELYISLRREKIRKRYPWILNFHPDHYAEGLKLLDDPDPTLRSRLLDWFGRAYSITPKQKKAALARIKKLPKSAERDEALEDLATR
jgi:hypothetical protein